MKRRKIEKHVGKLVELQNTDNLENSITNDDDDDDDNDGDEICTHFKNEKCFNDDDSTEMVVMKHNPLHQSREKSCNAAMVVKILTSAAASTSSSTGSTYNKHGTITVETAVKKVGHATPSNRLRVNNKESTTGRGT